MKAGGCNGVEFGLDVASDKMLAVLDKPFGQEETRIALQAAHDAGLPFAIYLLFGGPGETWADVEDTQNFLNSCAPANAVFATIGIRVYEGTPMARIAVQEGQVKPDQDLFEPAYYLSPGPGRGHRETSSIASRGGARSGLRRRTGAGPWCAGDRK